MSSLSPAPSSNTGLLFNQRYNCATCCAEIKTPAADAAFDRRHYRLHHLYIDPDSTDGCEFSLYDKLKEAGCTNGDMVALQVAETSYLCSICSRTVSTYALYGHFTKHHRLQDLGFKFADVHRITCRQFILASKGKHTASVNDAVTEQPVSLPRSAVAASVTRSASRAVKARKYSLEAVGLAAIGDEAPSTSNVEITMDMSPVTASKAYKLRKRVTVTMHQSEHPHGKLPKKVHLHLLPPRPRTCLGGRKTRSGRRTAHSSRTIKQEPVDLQDIPLVAFNSDAGKGQKRPLRGRSSSLEIAVPKSVKYLFESEPVRRRERVVFETWVCHCGYKTNSPRSREEHLQRHVIAEEQARKEENQRDERVMRLAARRLRQLAAM